MRIALLFSLLLITVINLNSQSCFPVGSKWSGNFSAINGWGTWIMSSSEDVWIKGILCQPLVLELTPWNPTGPYGKKTLLYHHDGESLYNVEEYSGAKTVLYQQYHLPGDSVLVPEEWKSLGLDISALVLDTFSISLIDSSWFAYSIDWIALAKDSTVSHDTATVIPGFGWWPGFSTGVPFGYLPTFMPVEGMGFSLHCAFIPGLGLYGSPPDCQLLVQTDNHQSTQGIIITPNPASVFIQLGGIHNAQSVKYQIIDMMGRIVKEANGLPESGNIQIDDIPVGCYHLLIWQEHSFSSWSGQFVKM